MPRLMAQPTMVQVCLAFLPSLLLAQEPPLGTELTDDRARLDSITDRGRQLAAYDVAAWHGTDAVQALHPGATDIRGYLARPGPDGRWEVLFGRPSQNADTFYVTFAATQVHPGDTTFTATAEVPPRPDTGSLAAAARALDTTRKAFGRATRPYNVAVLPAPAGSWWVYFMPAPTQWGVWPLGADVRYRVSADGRSILETRRLHNAILTFKKPPPSQGQLAASVHTHVVTDWPEDTDVFWVLERSPSVPEYIRTETKIFVIATDGGITAYRADR